MDADIQEWLSWYSLALPSSRMFYFHHYHYYVESQSSPARLVQWIYDRAISIDTNTGLLSLSLDLTRRALNGPLASVESSITAPLVELENKEDLMMIYLTHSQTIDSTVDLLEDDDDISTLSLASWIELPPIQVLNKLVRVNGDDIATLARSLTETEKLTHFQIQGYLGQCDQVDAIANYCMYYVNEILPSDPQAETLTFARFVISICYYQSTAEEDRGHGLSFWGMRMDCMNKILETVKALAVNAFVEHDEDLLSSIRLCERALQGLILLSPVILHQQESFTMDDSNQPLSPSPSSPLSPGFSSENAEGLSIESFSATSITTSKLRDWLVKDEQWMTEKALMDLTCEMIDLTELLALLQRPSIRYLQSFALLSIQQQGITSTTSLLQQLLSTVFSFLPSDILNHLLLSVLLQIGSTEALNTIHDLTERMKREFVQSTVLQTVCEIILSMNGYVNDDVNDDNG